MAFTQEEQEKFMQECYGCNINDFLDSVDKSIASVGSSSGMVVMSMLSDVQEMIELGMKDEARKTLNRAKYLINVKFMREV